MEKTEKKRWKNLIAASVARKVALTRERCTFKAESRGTVEEPERLVWFHRVDGQRSDLKAEIRHALLAYAFARGMPYRRVEAKTDRPVPADTIRYAASLLGFQLEESAISTWLQFELPAEVAAE